LKPGRLVMITRNDIGLYAQLSGQARVLLDAESETTFSSAKPPFKIEFLKTPDGSTTELILQFGPDVFNAARIADHVPERHEVFVAPQAMARLAGSYRFPAFDLTITFENQYLRMTLPGEDKVNLLPEGDTKYFVRDVDIQMEFFLDEKDRVTHLVMHRGPDE